MRPWRQRLPSAFSICSISPAGITKAYYVSAPGLSRALAVSSLSDIGQSTPSAGVSNVRFPPVADIRGGCDVGGGSERVAKLVRQKPVEKRNYERADDSSSIDTGSPLNGFDLRCSGDLEGCPREAVGLGRRGRSHDRDRDPRSDSAVSCFWGACGLTVHFATVGLQAT